VKGRYDPCKADHKAYWKRWKSKYQGMKVVEHPTLRRYIEDTLQKSWSPDAIAGRWNRDNARATGITITAKGVYKYLYSSYGRKLCRFLKYKRCSRKKRKGKKTKKILIPNRVLIDERPLAVKQRKRYGDFEADTMGVPKHTHVTLAVAVERKSRFILAKKIPRLKYAVDGFKELLSPLSVRTLTLDNGVENVRYEELGISTYFCHAYSSWEKGTVENAIGYLRWYIPKRADVSCYSDEDISAIVDTINSIPRKSLQYQTPKEIFQEQFLTQGVALQG
jgi:IS30 family transposase